MSHTSELKSLLIVDDCEEDRATYRHFLSKAPRDNYQIVEVDCAEDGLELCRQQQFDLLLLDFRLPEVDGLEFLLELQKQRLPMPPTIMLTAYGDEDVAVKAMKSGACDYLVKGDLRADVLQLAARNAIERAELQQQLEKSREQQRLIATTALRIRQSLDLEQILNTAVVEVRQLLQCDRAIICQLDGDGSSTTVVAESVEFGWKAMLGCNLHRLSWPIGNMGEGSEGWHEISNMSAVPLTVADRQLLEQFQVQARLAVPILSIAPDAPSTKKLWGFSIAHHCSSPRQWLSNEVETASELSVQLAIAIQQAELLSQTKAALAKEKGLNAFKSKIIETVSHEYRTPLTGILTAASTLEQHGKRLDGAMRQRCLQIIAERARHLSYLVDDMLFASQSRIEDVPYQPCLLDAEHFFAELIADRKVASNSSYEIVFRQTGDASGFFGDRHILRQVFGNLLSNAIKYSPDGGLIAIQLVGEGDRIQIDISDEGIGIPQCDLEVLFQSFRRGSNVGTISGTGLGLAIVKSCVERHNGQIAIESQEGQGTRVSVALPKQRQELDVVDLAS
ncbi:ATP-binding protein [Synechococcus sp. PCC 7336]|uniref:hybrid sensor histidine kinase/response regulator n=1 Tax=Synechococcus sp. PCC 7336 TaxID=195250 RepID=UPI00034DE35E|nr:ATP-binding protein [Synechococcus sp. PCC 7336]